MNQADVVRGLVALRSLVQPDGADVELIDVDASSGTVRLRLILEGAGCEESCVMPRPMLQEVARNVLRRAAPDIVSVSVDDPRDAHR
jgi:Fe-S cluster biogenesis protein NfuA